MADNALRDNSFPRQFRLRGRSAFMAVNSRGTRVRGRWCEIIIAPNPPEYASTTRLGISVTRRAGKAVRRNRIKRLIREYWRRNKWLWPENKAVLIRVKTPVDDEAGFLAELDDMLKNL